jgi:catechol 2,3-dioxygenase-like lactoylglutathione lyase family enzyme
MVHPFRCFSACLPAWRAGRAVILGEIGAVPGAFCSADRIVTADVYGAGVPFNRRSVQGRGEAVEPWFKGIGPVTLFVEDLAEVKEFYEDVFGLTAIFEDAHSVVFNFGNALVNLLKSSQAGELVEPATVGRPEAGARFQITIEVEDVDVVCEKLAERGVTFLNGPQDRPWGIRTAAFADPSGHVWEIAK